VPLAQPVPLGGPGTGLVRIVPSSGSLSLTEEIPSPEGAFVAPPSRRASIVFAVEAPVPHWAVAAEMDPLVGPEGPLASDRVRIGFPGSPDASVPFVSGAVIAIGTGPAPVPDVTFTLEIRPVWNDAPGVYTTQLRLIPLATGQALTPGTGTAGIAPAGPPQSISVSCEIPELMRVASEGSGFSLHAEAAAGTFYVQPDLTIVVATNRSNWQVRLEGSPFVNDAKREIPFDRLRWAPVGARGEIGEWSALAQSNVLLAGAGRRGLYRQQVRLAMDVTKADPAGSFGANLQLVGNGE
jgi:hypothetical protein